MKPPEETVDTTGARLHEALEAFRASKKPAPKKRATKKAAAKPAGAAGAASLAAGEQAESAPGSATAPAKTGAAAPAAAGEPHGRPLFAGKPYDATTTKLSLVVFEDENATKGTYAVDYLEETDAVVVGVREITPSRPDPKAKPDPRQTLMRQMRTVKLPKVTLDAPLGERPLLDAATGRPVEVWSD